MHVVRCRGTSLIRKRPPPQDPLRTLGMTLAPILYRGTSLVTKSTTLVPCHRPMPRVLRGVLEGRASSYGRGTPVQGYLTHMKQRPFRTLQKDHA